MSCFPLYIHPLRFVSQCANLSSLYLLALTEVAKYGLLKFAAPDHFHEEKPLRSGSQSRFTGNL